MGIDGFSNKKPQILKIKGHQRKSLKSASSAFQYKPVKTSANPLNLKSISANPLNLKSISANPKNLRHLRSI
jgi:hypothetical protein